MKATKIPTRRLVIDNLENLLAILHQDQSDCEAEIQKAVASGAYLTKYAYTSQANRLKAYADELECAIQWLNHHEVTGK